MKKRLQVIVLSVVMAMPLWAITANQSLSPAEALLGDDLRYELTVVSGPDDKVTLPDLSAGTWGPFVVKASEIETKESKGARRTTLTAVLSAFDLGLQSTPTLSETLALDPVSVSINGLISKLGIEAPRGSKAYAMLPVPWLAMVLKGLFVVLALAGLLYLGWYLHRKSKQEVAVVAEDPVDPKVAAYSAIKQLQGKRYIMKGRIDLYYFELTDIVKLFLSRIYQTPIVEMTTAEVVDHLQTPLDDQTMRRLKHVLTLGDLAKFAKYHPSEDENKQCLDRVFDLIERIQP